MSPFGLKTTPLARLAGITETVPLAVLATKALLPSGRNATPLGSSWTGTTATRRFASPRRSKNDTESLSGFAATRKASFAVSASGCDDVGPAKRDCGAVIGQGPTPSSAAAATAAPARSGRVRGRLIATPRGAVASTPAPRG